MVLICILVVVVLSFKFPIIFIYFFDLFVQLDKLLTFASKMAKMAITYTYY